jgi:hypothetical protein
MYETINTIFAYLISLGIIGTAEWISAAGLLSHNPEPPKAEGAKVTHRWGQPFYFIP